VPDANARRTRSCQTPKTTAIPPGRANWATSTKAALEGFSRTLRYPKSNRAGAPWQNHAQRATLSIPTPHGTSRSKRTRCSRGSFLVHAPAVRYATNLPAADHVGQSLALLKDTCVGAEHRLPGMAAREGPRQRCKRQQPLKNTTVQTHRMKNCHMPSRMQSQLNSAVPSKIGARPHREQTSNSLSPDFSSSHTGRRDRWKRIHDASSSRLSCTGASELRVKIADEGGLASAQCQRCALALRRNKVQCTRRGTTVSAPVSAS